MRALKDLAISTVRSVEAESTMTISSAKRTLARVRGRLCSSFFVMMATDSRGGIERTPRGFDLAICCFSFALSRRWKNGARVVALDQESVMAGSPRCSRSRRSSRVLRSSPVLGNVKRLVASFHSSLKLVATAEIQIWRTGVFGVTTNLLDPFSKMMFMTPLLSSNSKLPESSSALMRDCLSDSRARSDSRRKVASSIRLIFPSVLDEGFGVANGGRSSGGSSGTMFPSAVGCRIVMEAKGVMEQAVRNRHSGVNSILLQLARLTRRGISDARSRQYPPPCLPSQKNPCCANACPPYPCLYPRFIAITEERSRRH